MILEHYFFLFGFMSFILLIILVIVFKVFRFLYKFNKLYNFFIKPANEQNKKTTFRINKEGLPPINGDCPNREELNNLD